MRAPVLTPAADGAVICLHRVTAGRAVRLECVSASAFIANVVGAYIWEGRIMVDDRPTDIIGTHKLAGARRACLANSRYANAVLIKLLDAIEVAKNRWRIG
jgi:hypothetical protein